MLQREQIMRGKEHWPPKCVLLSPFSLFSCLATTQQRLVTSTRDLGVVSLHVNTSHFSTTARRVTSPTWGPPPPCKQALKSLFFRSQHVLQSDKNVPRLVTTGAINLKKKQSEWNTILCYEYPFYINTQVQMLKSFNSFLIQKYREHLARIFWDDGLVQEFLFYAYADALAGYFFFKITAPPPPLPKKYNG